MIVRIASEGQYRLDSDHLDQLNALDNQIVEAVARNDDAVFHRLFDQMLTFIRGKGQRLAENDLATSDVILPPADTSLAEARDLFAGEGALPG